MGGVWRPRVARTDKGQLIFVHARYDVVDPAERRGMIIAAKPLGGATTIEEMKSFTVRLRKACEEPIISTAEYEREEEDDE
jgi:hypothetical protein